MSAKPKVLVTGVNGQLGYDCVRELSQRGYDNVVPCDVNEFDITNRDQTLKFIAREKPSIVMHNAAYTAVDKAETDRTTAFAVNADGARNIAEACAAVGAKMLYVSTDYVFDGNKRGAYKTDDATNGLSVYGAAKALGEEYVRQTLQEHFIVRISWVFGKNGNNFVRTMLKLADGGKTELSVVSDQTGSPTYTFDLAKLLCDMAETERYGTYHATNGGETTWADFARAIFAAAHKNVTVHSVSTAEYYKDKPNSAPRPINSVLDKSALDAAGFKRLPSWQDALNRYLKEIL